MSEAFQKKKKYHLIKNSTSIYMSGWDKAVEMLGPAFNFTSEQALEVRDRMFRNALDVENDTVTKVVNTFAHETVGTDTPSSNNFPLA
ncbi:hypothetical protein Scep_009443 [Stephania cephalantha]|uniref:Uncharacterized protein n=1 Tax=Stephania cephalantha TaxID=152367 RepID=A0AAP0PD65_9MAGN